MEDTRTKVGLLVHFSGKKCADFGSFYRICLCISASPEVTMRLLRVLGVLLKILLVSVSQARAAMSKTIRRKDENLLTSKAITRGVTLMVFACVSIGTPRQSDATTITAVTVTITSNGNSVIANANAGWTFPVTLGPGQDLVLTQNTGPSAPQGAFSFDTSDFAQPLSDVAISVTADGVTMDFLDVLQVLTLRSVDPNPRPESLEWQEAQPYLLIGTGNGYEIFVGYADNLHTNPCGADVPAPLIGNPGCLPTPFADAFVFQGQGGPNTTGSSHCSVNDCYDAGVVRIHVPGGDPRSDPEQIPEPATIVLLGSGIVGLIAARRRHGKAKSRNEP
jgi:hypothetical protein